MARPWARMVFKDMVPSLFEEFHVFLFPKHQVQGCACRICVVKCWYYQLVVFSWDPQSGIEKDPAHSNPLTTAFLEAVHNSRSRVLEGSFAWLILSTNLRSNPLLFTKHFEVVVLIENAHSFIFTKHFCTLSFAFGTAVGGNWAQPGQVWSLTQFFSVDFSQSRIV